MENNFIGILYQGAAPEVNVIGALKEVIRDLVHVSGENIIIGVMDSKDITPILSSATIQKCQKSLAETNKIIETAKEILINQFKSLPSYIVQDKIPTNVLSAYMIHIYNISSEPRKYTLTSAVKKVLGHDAAKKGLMRSTSAKYVAALTNLLTYVEESQKSTAG